MGTISVSKVVRLASAGNESSILALANIRKQYDADVDVIRSKSEKIRNDQKDLALIFAQHIEIEVWYLEEGDTLDGKKANYEKRVGLSYQQVRNYGNIGASPQLLHVLMARGMTAANMIRRVGELHPNSMRAIVGKALQKCTNDKGKEKWVYTANEILGLAQRSKDTARTTATKRAALDAKSRATAEEVQSARVELEELRGNIKSAQDTVVELQSKIKVWKKRADVLGLLVD